MVSPGLRKIFSPTRYVSIWRLTLEIGCDTAPLGDWPRWHPRYDRERSDVLRYDRTGSDNGAIAHRYAWKYDRVRGDPDIAADIYRSMLITLLGYRDGRITKTVIDRPYLRSIGDHRAITD
jgi:hypothetical protein